MSSRAIRTYLECWLTILLILSGGSIAQKRIPRFPAPPSGSDSIEVQRNPESQQPKPRMNFAEMERESKELSQLAATIPGDVDLLKKGLLPKDALDKLKRIEKLSKHLRSEVAY